MEEGDNLLLREQVTEVGEAGKGAAEMGMSQVEQVNLLADGNESEMAVEGGAQEGHH